MLKKTSFVRSPSVWGHSQRGYPQSIPKTKMPYPTLPVRYARKRAATPPTLQVDEAAARLLHTIPYNSPMGPPSGGCPGRAGEPL